MGKKKIEKLLIIDDEKFADMSEDELKEYADELAARAVKKIEPFTRIVTLLSLIGVSIFLTVMLVRGTYAGGVFFLPRIEARTGVLVATVIFGIVSLWHLVSTIRFFVNRRK